MVRTSIRYSTKNIATDKMYARCFTQHGITQYFIMLSDGRKKYHSNYILGYPIGTLVVFNVIYNFMYAPSFYLNIFLNNYQFRVGLCHWRQNGFLLLIMFRNFS